ncbi:hypothetical protein APHAL10511_001186 [Amanita phalloides]|nr:hypothetical protein APHAL10511_001186 [Amanita phalloides]
MDQDDPISQFFPDQETDLYAVLQLKRDASAEDIRKTYRRLALKYHPDKHGTASEDAKKDASLKFQQVGFAYAILNDEKKRKRYDKTGTTADSFDLGEGEDGWEAYFEDLFDRVTRGRLDEMKKEYQGSAEETEDLKGAYLDTQGSIGEIMNFIPHSTQDDEARFIIAISRLISKEELPNLPLWESSTKDEKARLVRKEKSGKEATEAEQLAKELGVWDEFYGSGKTGKRGRKGRSKGHGKDNGDAADEEAEDYSALQALILKKKEKNMDSFFDSLAAKYTGTEKKSKNKGKKRGRDADSEEKSPQKKRSTVKAPDIDDEEFARLQEGLFGDKTEVSTKAKSKSTRASQRKKLG